MTYILSSKIDQKDWYECRHCGYAVDKDDIVIRKNGSNRGKKIQWNSLLCKDCYQTVNAKKARDFYSTESGKISVKNTRIRQAKKFPEKVKARGELGYAVRTGKVIKKPCEVCGILDVQGHHTDYTKPLEVRWLCPLHHRRVELGLIKL